MSETDKSYWLLSETSGIGETRDPRLNRGLSLLEGLQWLPAGWRDFWIRPASSLAYGVAVFLLSVYNGPSAAVIDELGPPQFSGTLQGVSLFLAHVLGNAPAGPVTGFIADRSSTSLALQTTMLAFGVSGVLFMIVAHRQRREPAH